MPHKKKMNIYTLKKALHEYFIWESVSQYLRFTFFLSNKKKEIFMMDMNKKDERRDMSFSCVPNIEYIYMLKEIRNASNIYRLRSFVADSYR